MNMNLYIVSVDLINGLSLIAIFSGVLVFTKKNPIVSLFLIFFYTSLLLVLLVFALRSMGLLELAYFFEYLFPIVLVLISGFILVNSLRHSWLRSNLPYFFVSNLFHIILNRAYNYLEWFLISPPKPHPFISLPLQSGKDFVTIFLAGFFFTIPASYLLIVKNFGIGFLLGVPIFANIVDFSMTEIVTLASLEAELGDILTQLNRLLPQLNTFITQFNNFVLEVGINVVTDVGGALGIDVPATLADDIAQQYANRIDVLDSLIHHHTDIISDLLARGSEIEGQIAALGGDSESQLSEFSDRFRQLQSEYRH